MSPQSSGESFLADVEESAFLFVSERRNPDKF